MKYSERNIAIAAALVVGTATLVLTPAAWGGSNRPSWSRGAVNFESYEWDQVNRPDEEWAPRAGLQVVNLRNRLYLMGGRTPIDPEVLPVPGASIIWGDVWESRNQGRTWRRILGTAEPGHWPARAYFEAVTKGRKMFVIGGQDTKVVEIPSPAGPQLVLSSTFFNDVWCSRNGRHWTQLTADAGWEERAGLSAVVHRGEIYVMGGSKFDDDSIVGPGGPMREYFNDVWKSSDGINWTQVTANAPWAPRAGARVVTKNGYMYLVGGEEGFVCFPLPFCEPPYFNDVWRSRDGENWELVTDDAEWAPRPGHQCVVLNDHFVLFGGFGLGDTLAEPANPMDVWVSRDGARWRQVDDAPWNAESPADVKYDFDALVLRNGWRKAIYTFGGDRETFDFEDPLNYLNVDNDVWKYAPPHPRWRQKERRGDK